MPKGTSRPSANRTYKHRLQAYSYPEADTVILWSRDPQSARQWLRLMLEKLGDDVGTGKWRLDSSGWSRLQDQRNFELPPRPPSVYDVTLAALRESPDPMTGQQLAESCGVSYRSLCRSMDRLRRNGLASSERRGRNVVYRAV